MAASACTWSSGSAARTAGRCARAASTCGRASPAPPPPDLASARAGGVADVVGGGDLLGDDHAPGVDDELAGFGRVQGSKVGVDPVEAQIRRRRHLELVRLAQDERLPLLLVEREAHDALVQGERHVDNLLDAELQSAAYVHLVRTLQLGAQLPDVVDHGHAGRTTT